MRKYLNKSLLYQGDSKITLFLSIVYLVSFSLNKGMVDTYFNYYIRVIYINSKLPYKWYTIDVYKFRMFYLGIYLIICYLIIVGVHKRKNGHYY